MSVKKLFFFGEASLLHSGRMITVNEWFLYLAKESILRIMFHTSFLHLFPFNIPEYLAFKLRLQKAVSGVSFYTKTLYSKGA